MNIQKFPHEFSVELRVINGMNDVQDIRNAISNSAQQLLRYYKLLQSSNLSKYDQRRLNNEYLRLQ